mmetsp:Transcript_15740/g.51425  ORF Transcript_15740/g.51425 Transcript_15740/m.51425 type:complete len:260 (+) Transcript_15740:501-1280(+)
MRVDPGSASPEDVSTRTWSPTISRASIRPPPMALDIPRSMRQTLPHAQLIFSCGVCPTTSLLAFSSSRASPSSAQTGLASSTSGGLERCLVQMGERRPGAVSSSGGMPRSPRSHAAAAALIACASRAISGVTPACTNAVVPTTATTGQEENSTASLPPGWKAAALSSPKPPDLGETNGAATPRTFITSWLPNIVMTRPPSSAAAVFTSRSSSSTLYSSSPRSSTSPTCTKVASPPVHLRDAADQSPDSSRISVRACTSP